MSSGTPDADDPVPAPSAEEVEDEAPTLKDDLKWGVALMLMVILAITSFTADLWWSRPLGVESFGSFQDAGGHARPGITEELFQTWVVAFEILGVLLLAALVGAIVIALREDGEVA